VRSLPPLLALIQEDLEFLNALTIHNAELNVAVITSQEDLKQSELMPTFHSWRWRRDLAMIHAASTRALVRARESTNPDSALYVPALATPNNVSLVVYAGVDLVDPIMAEVKARGGYPSLLKRTPVLTRLLVLIVCATLQRRQQ